MVRLKYGPTIQQSIEAKYVYNSTLSNLMKEYVKVIYNIDNYYILSAKYGIIHNSKKIENYNISFYDKDKCITINKIKEILPIELKDINEVIFIGGNLYKEILSNIFTNIICPIPSLSMGYMIQYLQKEIRQNNTKTNNLFEF